MTRLANVLIVETTTKHADILAQRLMNGGYHVSRAQADGGALAKIRDVHPDLVLIGPMDDARVDELGRAIKADDADGDIPVLLLTEHASRPPNDALATWADDIIDIGCSDTELFARLRPLVRLSTMHGELRQRIRTARFLGVDVHVQINPTRYSRPNLMLIGDRAAMIHADLATDADVTLSDNLFQAEDLLSRQNFDAVVLAFFHEPEEILGFCSQVRNNPRLFNLPLVLIHDGDPDEAYRRGATRVLPAMSSDPAALWSVLLPLVRRQQLRWSIRSALNETLQGAARDGATATYSRAFLDAYLNDRLATATVQDRHLSIIFFSAPNIDNIRKQFGDDPAAHLAEQIGQWIGGLLRTEDLTATFAPNEYCVVLPDTPLAEAEVVMHRIAGVLAFTDFAVRDVYQPVKVWVQAGCTDARKGDTLSHLLARARRDLD